MSDSIWPSVHVNGDLARACVEWITGNGTGAYASSTVALMHTRRYHGLLVAPLSPPMKRTIIVSHYDIRAQVDGGEVELCSHQFPGVPPKQGYKQLQWFHQDPLPRWVYDLGNGTFQKTLALVRGVNAVVFRFQWDGDKPLMLSARPLLGLRNHHSLSHAHGAMIQRVSMRPNEVHAQPDLSLPPIVFHHSGMFIGSPDWWHRFEYLQEQARGLEFQEDLWSPGAFRLKLEPGMAQYMITALGALPSEPASKLLDQAADYLRSCDPGPKRPVSVRKLFVAADLYRADLCDKPSIIAGYPWFEVWGRHTFISLEGLYLVTGRAQQAKAVTQTLLSHLQNGLLPNRLPENGQPPEYNGADASLMLMFLARTFVEALPSDDPFGQEILLPALRKIFEAHVAGTINNIHLTYQGLLASGVVGVTSLTWMDARIGNKPVTCRAGLAIELQAMWTKGCDNLAWLASRYDDSELAQRAARARDVARASFGKRFWNDAAAYPFDVVSESDSPPHAWTIDSIRPNALIALSIDPDLFTDEQAKHIIERVEQHLVCDMGLRTLSPQDPDYHRTYQGDVESRDRAYHQGTVWPHLIGVLSAATKRVFPNDEHRRKRIETMIDNALHRSVALGQVSELAQAEPPHDADGCTAYANAVAQFLRVLVCHHGL